MTTRRNIAWNDRWVIGLPARIVLTFEPLIALSALSALNR
jgi:hypothetical protein